MGIIVAGLGVKGETVTKTVEVDGAPVQSQVVSKTKKAASTNSEIQKIFEPFIFPQFKAVKLLQGENAELNFQPNCA